MFGISFEHLLIVGVILLIFGPKRLPELGHTMGKAIKNFKDSISGVEEAKIKQIQPETTTAYNPANTGAGASVNNAAGATVAGSATTSSATDNKSNNQTNA